jgi:uncharacterized protein
VRTDTQPAAAEPIPRAARSLAPDLARGAMLLLIVLANVGLYRWGVDLDAYGVPLDASAGDRIALALERLLVAERARPMFAILFGFGLATMVSRLTRRGVDAAGVRAILRRRNWALVGLGVLHAGLLFFGDILAAYGATGLVAVLLVQRSDRVVRRWTGATLVYVVLGFSVVMSLAVSGTLDLGLGATDAPLAESYLGGVVLGAGIGLGHAAMAVVLAAYLPLVLVGVLIQRAGWLERPEAHLPALRRGFALGMVVNLASSTPVALLALGVWQPGGLGTFVASYLTLVGGLVAGFGYVCGFALLAHRWAARDRRAVPGALASLGERSLTGYLGQSLVLAPLLAPWGLALGDGLRLLPAYGLAAATWLLTLVVLARVRGRGPFETVLRRLTYGPPR